MIFLEATIGHKNTMNNIFNKLLTITIALVLSGCMGLPFTPETEEGLQCKVDCGFRATSCSSSPMNCDNGYRRCINGCRDIDRIMLKK
jgi:hypothetical protein